VRIEGAVVLVTGANRGLGRTFASGFATAGAATVYGTVRDAAAATGADFHPVVLDITKLDSVHAAAQALSDVTIVVNNAGINTWTPILGDSDDIRAELNVNFFGMLSVAKAFAPVLKANGGGYLVNVLSTLSWYTGPEYAGYAAAKAASWSATNALRLELHSQGTGVLAVHCGPLDTNMGSKATGTKLAPEDVVGQTIRAIEADQHEVLTDAMTARVRERLSAPLRVLYPVLGSPTDG
jgi:NAD(P)-dependent dehydrogenase (short-subunit alcohol dehydrogenase family)